MTITTLAAHKGNTWKLELDDSGELVGSGMKPLTKEEIEALRDSVLPDIPSTQIRGQ